MARLSRVELASKAKVSDATIKFIETAHHRPSRSTLTGLLDVAELQLTWADVPGQKSPVETQNLPALPPQGAPLTRVGPSPDLAHFLMDLIGFEEICLPQDAPTNLRIFQQRHRAAEKPDDQ